MHACTQQACQQSYYSHVVLLLILRCVYYRLLKCWKTLLKALLRMPSGLFIILEWKVHFLLILLYCLLDLIDQYALIFNGNAVIYLYYISFIYCILFYFIWYVFHFPHLHRFRCLCCYFYKIFFYYYLIKYSAEKG